MTIRKKTQPKPKAAPKPATPPLVRPGTSPLVTILEHALKGTETYEQIAAAAGIRVDQARHRLGYVLKQRGVSNTVDEKGRVKAALPA